MVRYDKFFWGMSQDDRIQSGGEYTYGQNINIRKGKWIELSRKPEALSTGTTASAGTSITANFDDYYGTNNGKILNSTDWGLTFWLVYTWPDTDDVISMQAMSGDLFWWLDNKMYVRTNYTDGAPWVTGGNVTEVSTNASDYRQTIVVGDDLIFFINGKQIGKVTSATPTTVSDYGDAFSVAFKTYSQIVGISLHGNTLWVYENTGKMYALDNQSEDVIGFKDFKETIIAVRNMGSYDIVITTSVTNPNVRSWYSNTGVAPESEQLIRRYVYSETVANWVTLWGYRFWFDQINPGRDFCFADNEWILYWVSDEIGSNIIYSYWRNNNTLPDSFSIISTVNENGDTWGNIDAIWVTGGYLVVSETRGASNYLKKIQLWDSSTSIYNSSGFLITKVDDSGAYEIPHIIKQFLLGSDLPDNTQAQIDYSINEGAFVPYLTITNADAIWTWANWKKYEFSTPIEMYNEISWRLTLSTTDETVTPKIFSVSHILESELVVPSQ